MAAETEAGPDYQIVDFRASVDNDTLGVTATVENVGDTAGTEPVELYVDGERRQTVSVELAPSEERTLTFSVPTDELGPGSQPVRLETPTDSRTQMVVIDAHTLRIAGTGTHAEYEFYLETDWTQRDINDEGKRIVEVRGLEDAEYYRTNAIAGEGSGTVRGGNDTYVISGELEFVFFTGATEGRVYLDGERIDPDDYGVKHTIRFVGNGTASPYSFDTAGTLPPESMTAGNRDIVGTTAVEEFNWRDGDGVVYRGRDVYRFIGPLESVYVGGADPATVYLDGERIDPNDYGERRLLRFVGNGTDAEYAFTTTGTISAFSRASFEREGGDEIYEGGPYGQYPADRDSGAYATGRVQGGSDEYFVEGDLDGLEAQPGVTVYLDGERIDPANYTETDVHTLKVVGAGDKSTYGFSVDGEIFAVRGLGPADGLGFSSLPAEGNSGFVSGGTDIYYYIGAAEPTSLTVNGNATVLVDGEEINPDTVG